MEPDKFYERLGRAHGVADVTNDHDLGLQRKTKSAGVIFQKPPYRRMIPDSNERGEIIVDSHGNVIVGGDDEVLKPSIIDDARAYHRSKLLNAPRATNSHPFTDAPPLTAYADYEGRRFLVLDAEGSVDPQLVWGSYQLAVRELSQDDPTRQLLTKMAQKFGIGIYNDEWKKTPPSPEFLNSRQFALEAVKRQRELFSSVNLSTTPTEESDPEPSRPITLRITKESGWKGVRESAINELEELQNRTRFNSISARGNPGVFAAGYKQGVADAIQVLRSPVYVRESKNADQ